MSKLKTASQWDKIEWRNYLTATVLTPGWSCKRDGYSPVAAGTEHKETEVVGCVSL